jgi:hypothetical protein
MKKVRTTQLILNGVALPYVSGDRYSAHPATLSRQVEMISGRVVSEERGKVWRITYSADYIDDTTCRAALAVLRAGTPFTAAFLPDNGDELVSAEVLVESLTDPTFAFTSHGVPRWHNVGFTLREVRPHD